MLLYYFIGFVVIMTVGRFLMSKTDESFYKDLHERIEERFDDKD